MTYPDQRYLIHGLLRDYYFIVHSQPESKKTMTDSDSMTVTLIPASSVTPNESGQYPSSLCFLDINQLEFRLISSIPGAMTFTDAPFFNDPIWIDGRDLPPDKEPDCNIWFYPMGCGHRLGSIELPVSGFTIKSMLSKCISHAATTSRLMLQGCQQCWDFQKDRSIIGIPEEIKPIYIQRDYLKNWTYRNPMTDWIGMFAYERYVVNVQDIDDGEICGKIVKPWHWTSFWNQIVYDAEWWAPTKEGSGCVLLGLDDIQHKPKAREGGHGQYSWWRQKRKPYFED
ncbi:hypothetical protein TWF281_009796 [Arthrobotrys megalospora]